MKSVVLLLVGFLLISLAYLQPVQASPPGTDAIIMTLADQAPQIVPEQTTVLPAIMDASKIPIGLYDELFVASVPSAITQTPVYYTAGISLDGISNDVLIYIGVFLLGLISAVTIRKISPIAAKTSNVAESVAKFGYETSNTLNDIGLTKMGTIVKEGSEVADEFGDVATVLANSTADGKFTAEEAKKVLAEGKDVVVAMKNFIVTVKPKKAQATPAV